MTDSIDFFSFIDAVLVINLDARNDRWARISKLAAASNLPLEKIHRVSALYGKNLPGYGKQPWFRGRKRDVMWGGTGGCALSHKKAIETAKRNNWKTVLVLEDDATWNPSLRESLDQIAPILAAHRQHWDVCYLGYIMPLAPFHKLATTANQDLFRIYGAFGGHAYLLNQKALALLVTTLPNQASIWSWLSVYGAIDIWYCIYLSLRLKVTAISPALIWQAGNDTDIATHIPARAISKSYAASIPQNTPPKSFGVYKMLMRAKCMRLRFRAVFIRLFGFR